MATTELASQRACVDRIRNAWPEFQHRRQAQLNAVSVASTPAEKIAENILCDLFTTVLDWTTEQVRLQEDRVDLLLTRMGVKCLIVEVKRPGSFDGPGSIERALKQALGYAGERNVGKVAVSDACILRAYDVADHGLRPRATAHLADAMAPESLWWLSARGIYRTPAATEPEIAVPSDDELLHPRYQLPARCFGYVGHPERTTTWKLPYLRADGNVDERRLPKAIGALLRDYRGAHVNGIPEAQVPDVLVRLAQAAARTGRLPHQDPTPAEVYVALRDALVQFQRYTEVTMLPAI